MEEYFMVLKLGIRLAVCALSLMVIATGSGILSAAGRVSSKPEGQVHSQKAEFNPRGQVLALSCTSCHGTDGKSAGIIPSIYGRSAVYLETALKAFKSGARYSTVMSRHAKGYSDEELRLIAEYFAMISHNHK